MGDQQKDQSIQKPQTPPPTVAKEAKTPDLNQKSKTDDTEVESDEDADLASSKKPQ